MSREMIKAGYDRDLGQCRTKIKHLKNVYKKHKDSLNRSGVGWVKEPLLFERLDILLGDRAQAVGLEIGVDTSSTTGNNFASKTPSSPSIADTESGKHPFDVF
jgi:hypothetical protein